MDVPPDAAPAAEVNVPKEYDPRDIATKPVRFYRPEIITSSKKISDIVTSINSNAVLIAPGPKPTFKKVNAVQPMADILGQITKTHLREPAKPKGSRNVPVTTKRTICVRTNPSQAAFSFNPQTHESVIPLAAGNRPMSAGKGPTD